ncbi:MAG: hypothetical protein SFH39_05665 [Candidatus Magnetobacterium sp. LHC-1]|uniref:Uncharacterized protein n=2 Tax=Candidatus Magnetobacterium casense TaxID=1455061 RepID=A0ABS6RWK1_9BACT|nr:hypothetical protein [Nitrospirota bacterium]MBV6341001.1 hypothetical protein [Candidatus Magnetobacterium casensis]
MTQWLDRKKYKEKFRGYFNGDHKLSLICVNDEQEIGDVATWLLETMQDKQTIASAVYHSQVKALRHGLLEQITHELGARDNFPNYYKRVDILSKPKESPLIVNNYNTVADKSSAGNDMPISNIEQTINTNIPDEATKLILKKRTL